MLQVKNLVKRYVAKGETVTALDGVSVDFPERGMVFLLGKSGSGKSTLLNVSGGLDEPDEGEVIVNGKSSKDFTKGDFDSYRNTYLGFIFQEYNILTELTVAENVALALELQGRSKGAARVQELLKQVDLEGYGDRRPNTLSSGQRQRVAIARALVKDPEIIMADEPTGALDSATGAQVFDTLKKLSESKLVIVVSHDREFAEVYADRIIELKDGRIISDVSRGEEIAVEKKNVKEVTDKKLSVLSGANLSAEEEARILTFVRNHKGGVVISADDADLALLPKEKAAVSFTDTDLSALTSPEKTECNFISSKFPFRYALKMGIAGLRTKPVRLVFTTLLATIAFIVFGIFSTLITYNTAKAGISTLTDSTYQAAVLEKHGVMTVKPANGASFTQELDTGVSLSHFSTEEVEKMIAKHPGMHFVPAYTLEIPNISYWSGTIPPAIASHAYYGHMASFAAFADATYLDTSGFELHGELPKTANECVVSTMIYDAYRYFGYGNSTENSVAIGSYDDLIGKTFHITHNANVVTDGAKRTIALTVTGVVDTHESFSAYATLLQGQAVSGLGAVEWRALEQGLAGVFKYSMSALCWVGEGFYETYKPDNTTNYFRNNLSNTVQTIMDSNVGAEFDSDFLLKDEEGNFVKEPLFGGGRPGIQFNFSRYFVDPDAEPEGSYIQYLYAPLAGNRAGKSGVVFGYDHKETAQGYYYDAPYAFMVDIRNSEKDFTQIFAILGAVAVALAVFAALLLFNFISASINAKKKDIGILRAVGARGIDVYKIFMVEGVAITLLCFGLGSILSYVACLVANSVLIAAGVFVFKLFLFDILNVLLVFAIAFVTAVVSTTIPVALAVKKKPVEAIRSV